MAEDKIDSRNESTPANLNAEVVGKEDEDLFECRSMAPNEGGQVERGKSGIRESFPSSAYKTA